MTLFRKYLIKSCYALACGEDPFKVKNDYPLSEKSMTDSYFEKLKMVVEYAFNSTHHYKKKYRDYYTDIISDGNFLDTFKRLPFLEKEHIRDNGGDDLRVRGVKGILRKTTGSTGIPVKVYVDSYTLANQLRSRWMFFSWHGVVPGDIEGRFWGRNIERTFQSQLKDFLLNRVLFQTEQQNDQGFHENLRRLQYVNPRYFYGYPSLLLKYAEAYDSKDKIRPKPRVIFSTAEMLSEAQRKYLSTVFDCPVYQEYGCSEVDIIAFECPHGRYHLNTNRLYLELFEDEDNSSKIIVTDLDNRCMPIIRYRLGDSIQLTDLPCPCGRPFAYFSRVLGRSSDRLISLPDGSSVHAVMFAHLVEGLIEDGYFIRQYKINHVNPTSIVFIIDGKFENNKKEYVNKLVMEKSEKIVRNKININVIFAEISNKKKNFYYEKMF